MTCISEYGSFLSTIVLLFICAGCFVFIAACNKDGDDAVNPGPGINFRDDAGFICRDTTLKIGDSVRIGIIADAGTQHITLLRYRITADATTSSVDSGMNTSHLDFEKVIVKGIADSERWEFMVRDKEKKSATVSLVLLKDTSSVFGDMSRIPSVVLGAQNNTTTGSFFSFSTGLTYMLLNAFNNQGLINLAYFYDDFQGDENTIASPGANIDASVFPGSAGLSEWNVKNTTRFTEATDVSAVAFDTATNDSLILANTFEFASGKRKCKDLEAGDIYAFVAEDGKRGLIKVINVNGTDQGTVEIDIILQE
ncbi:MAG: hypothetical protein KJ607_09540 [Bacteroidetes bacterium]|nr:hypothetical protein [Bacteroidota bacterium]